MKVKISIFFFTTWLTTGVLLSSPNLSFGQTISIEATPTYLNFNQPSLTTISLPNLNLSSTGSKLEGAFRLLLPSGMWFASAVDDASASEISFLQSGGITNQLVIKTNAATEFISLRVTVSLSNGFSGDVDIALINGDADSLNSIGLVESTVNFGTVIPLENYEDDHGAIRESASELAVNQSITGALISRDTDGFLIEILEHGKLTLTLSQIDSTDLSLQGSDRCLVDFTIEESATGLVLQTGTLSPGSYFIEIRGGIFSSGSYTLGNSFEPASAPNLGALFSTEPFKFGYEINEATSNEVRVGDITLSVDFDVTPFGRGFRIIAPEGASFGTAESDNQRNALTKFELLDFPRLIRADTTNDGAIDTLRIYPLCFDTTVSFTALIEEGFSGELIFEIKNGWSSNQAGLNIDGVNQKRSLGRVLLEPEASQKLPIANNGNLAVFDTATSLLHLPILLSNGRVFWADLSYSGRGKFTVAGFAPTIAFSPLYATFEENSGTLLIRNVGIFSDAGLGSERFNLVLKLDSNGEEFQIQSIENRF